MSEIFFLNPDYAAEYDLHHAFDRTKLKLETLADDPDGDKATLGCLFRLMVPCLIVLAIVTLPFIGDQQYRNTVISDGIPVQVTVTECVMSRVDSYDRDPKITYTYQIEDKHYTETRILNTSAECFKLPPDTVLSGLYLPDKPDHVVFPLKGLGTDSYASQMLLPIIQMIAGYFAAFGGIGALAWYILLGIGYVSYTRRYRALVTRGVILDGEVLDAVGSGDEWLRYKVTVTYTFKGPGKRDLIRYQTLRREDLKHKKLPRKGARVKVLYAGDHACVML